MHFRVTSFLKVKVQNGLGLGPRNWEIFWGLLKFQTFFLDA